MSISNRKLVAAVQSLARIRVLEQQEADGLRRVWHQGAEGGDLLSWVDPQGRLLRQELTLLDDYFLWTSTQGARTGATTDSGGAATARASEMVAFDPFVSADRVHRGLAALKLYRGQDRYILHFHEILELIASGLEERREPIVTGPVPPVPMPSAPPRPSRPPRRLVWLVAGGIVLACAALLLILSRAAA
jgi:hypothetical protein